MKTSLRKIALSALALGSLPFMGYAAPTSTPVYTHSGTQQMVLCENSPATPINAFLTVTDNPLIPTTETWTVISGPFNGSTVAGTTQPSGPGNITPTGFTYRSHTGYTGADSFIVQVSNGSNTATTKIVVNVNPLPGIYTFTGGGGYCFGSAGVPVGLTLTDTGTSYQLYMTGGGAVGNPVIGLGSAITFDTILNTPGTYYAIATNIHTLCTSSLSGVTVFINTQPTIFDVNGGGSYCTGGTGVAVGLANSDAGVSYQLYNNSVIDGAPVAGNGSAISFGLQTAAGPYTVMATDNSTNCVSAMSGSAADTLLPLPTPFNVTGGGSFCLGNFSGLAVGLDSSETGVSYHLLYGGIIPITTKAGTGNALNFGTQIAPGSYVVTATNTTTGCADTMTGHRNVNVNIPPTPRLVTGGGSMCTIDSGFHIDLNGSTLGVSYQLYMGSTATTALPGTGNALDFGLIATAGTYTVFATDTTSGCTTNMLGSATIIVNPVLIPTVSLVANPGIGNTVCYGVPVTFTGQTNNGGTAPVYVWNINGINPVTTDSSYSYTPRNGDVVSVALTSNAVCAIPDTATSTMTMDVDTAAAPSVFINVSPINSVAPNTSVTLTAVVTNGGSTVTYQWYKNGVAIEGATSSVYNSSTFTNQDSMTCQVISSSGCGPVATFNSVVITVYPNGVAQVGAAAGNVTLVPNPNKGTFTVKGTIGTTLDEDVSIEITDMLGQVVYKSQVVAKDGVIDQQIQLSNTLANGMYMLNIGSGAAHKVLRFVIGQ